MTAQDITSTLGCVIMTAIIYVFVQIIIDILYAFIDPRVKSRYVRNRIKKTPQSEENITSRAASQPLSAQADVSREKRAELVKATMYYASSAAQASASYSDSNLLNTQRGTTSDVQQESNAADNSSAKKQNDAAAAAVPHDTGEIFTRKYKKRSQVGDVFYRLTRNKGATVGLVIFSIVILLFFASLFISWESVTAGDARDRLIKPNPQHLFGTDIMGRDQFSRIIYGTRYSMTIGFGGSLIAAFLGISLGCFAGFYGGKVEEIIMRATDVLVSIPGLLLGMVLVLTLGRNLQNLIFAVAVNTIPIYVRITRASVLTVRNNEFVEAAHAIGLPNLRVIFSQVLPNGLSPIIVTFTMNLGGMISAGAGLSFLGFGIQVPHPEWGMLISQGREYMRTSGYLTIIPGLFIMATILALNLLGDGLRDALDPKLKGRK